MSNFDTRKIFIESVAIVASIMLAFAIDAAWDARNELKLESDILSAIYSDMVRNLEEIDRAMESYDTSIGATNKFMSLTPQQLSHEEIDDSRSGLNGIFFTYTYTPFLGSLTNANLSQVQDLTMRNLLGTWIGLSSNLQEDLTRLLNNQAEVHRYASPSGAILRGNIAQGLVSPDGPDGSPENNQIFSSLREDQEFVNALLRQNIGFSTSRFKAIRLKEATEELVLILEGRN